MVTIGVTGHRVLAERERLDAGLESAARRIADVFADGEWTVVSALAEGADRLVARRLLTRPGSRLVAVLPLPPDDYERDFATAESREEFRAALAAADEVVEPPPASTRDQAYAAAGRYVLDRADVLVALWNGRSGRGAGGTADVVAAARAQGLPIAWVHAGNRRPGNPEPTTLGAEQGEVTFERFPEARTR